MFCWVHPPTKLISKYKCIYRLYTCLVFIKIKGPIAFGGSDSLIQKSITLLNTSLTTVDPSLDIICYILFTQKDHWITSDAALKTVHNVLCVYTKVYIPIGAQTNMAAFKNLFKWISIQIYYKYVLQIALWMTNIGSFTIHKHGKEQQNVCFK